MMRGRNILIVIVLAIACIGCFIRLRYVLSSAGLEQAIRHEIPIGSTHQEVLNFVETRHPRFFDNNANQVKARFEGLAENMIYKKDVILTFDFDSSGKLKSYSMKSYLTFL